MRNCCFKPKTLPFFRMLFFIFIVFSCKAQKKNDSYIEKSNTENTLLWKVSGNRMNPVYLFGTMHLLCAEDAVLSKNLMAVLKNTEKIYMELDMDDLAGMMDAMSKMQMNNGTKLKDLLTTAEYEKVKVFFNKKGGLIPFEMMENYKPLLTASTMVEEEMPCKNGLSGIEMRIMEWNSKNGKKEILGLESVGMQLAIFDSIPYKEQAQMLLQYIDSLPGTLKETGELVAAYKKQNLKEITDLVSKSEPGLEKYADLLLANRNKNWVEQIKKIAAKKSVIVAVGAGHLVGAEGLIMLFKKQGYTLTPLQNQ
jgi:uncharacterized protein YbaP (TraB family)